MARLNILHISDLHFASEEVEGVDGEKQRSSTHYFEQKGEPDPLQLAEILQADFHDRAPDLIVASGDIGSGGQAQDYTYAAKFFERLREIWGEAVPLVLTPGNHDVDRTEEHDARRQANFVDLLRSVHGSAFGEIHPLFNENDRDTLIGIHRILERDGDVMAVVVSMNSAAGLQTRDTPVRIDPGAIQALDKHLKKERLPDNALKIFVLHHHLLPFAESPRTPTHNTRHASEQQGDADLVANSAKLHTWLVQRKFHLVLHGHKHTSHARQDQLWRSNDRTGRSLLIVGAGTTGARNGSRAHSEHLTFNRLIATRFSAERWQIRVDVRQIAPDLINPEARSHYPFTAMVGVESEQDRLHPTFRAEHMNDCHRAIAEANRPDELGQDGALQYNFLSIVEDSTYVHPQTVQIRNAHIDSDLIERCFATLHPEHEPTGGWTNLTDIDKHLHLAQLGYRFEHGSRMFQSPDGRVRQPNEQFPANSPVLQAIKQLQADSRTSKAYFSLYRPEIDVLSSGRQPLPGLMGLHFVERYGKLDLSATFRKLELSFWWCLNMYELGELLRWVCGQVRKQPGRLSFFASLAQWKSNPDAPMRAKIDQYSIAQLLPMVLKIEHHKHELAELLEEKHQLINDTHLEGEGLENLEQLLSGLDDSHSSRLGPLRELVTRARREIEQAAHAHNLNRQHHVDSCLTALREAIKTLD